MYLGKYYIINIGFISKTLKFKSLCMKELFQNLKIFINKFTFFVCGENTVKR